MCNRDRAPLYHVGTAASPILLVTGGREKELLGRYEENAYLMRMLKINGNSDVSLFELKDYGHMVVEPGVPLVLEFIRKERSQEAFFATGEWKMWNDGQLMKAGLKTALSADGYTATIPEGKRGYPTVQLYHDFEFNVGKKHDVKLTVTAETAGKVYLVYLLSSPPYTDYAKAVLNIRPGTAEYNAVLAPKYTNAEGTKSLRIMIGKMTGQVSITSVSVDAQPLAIGKK
jgi:hypothetical protein